MLNIALNTFKEIVRNKFLYVILLFAFLFIIFSISLWKLTIWEDEKVIVDFWVAMIEIFWFIWVLFVWSQLLFKEIEGKTIFLILSKPIHRYEFILWKFVWFSFVIFCISFFQSLVYLWVLAFKWIPIDVLILASLFFIFFKLIILIAVVLFFSTFMSNIITILVSVMVYFLSHNFSIILDLAHKIKNDVLITITFLLQWIFPPYEFMNFKDRIWSFTQPTVLEYTTTLGHALLYLVVILIFTQLIFNRKKFEN